MSYNLQLIDTVAREYCGSTFRSGHTDSPNAARPNRLSPFACCRFQLGLFIFSFLHLLLFHPFLSGYLTLKFIPRRLEQRERRGPNESPPASGIHHHRPTIDLSSCSDGFARRCHDHRISSANAGHRRDGRPPERIILRLIFV